MTPSTSRGGRSWVSPCDLVLLLLVVSAVMSYATSPVTECAQAFALYLCIGLLFYLLASKGIVVLGHAHRFVWAVEMFGVGLCVFAPLGVFEPDHALLRQFPTYASLRPFLPDTFNRNVVSGATVMVIPFALAEALTPVRPYKWVRRAAAMALALSLIILLIGMESRAGYIATIAGLVVFTLLVVPRWATWLVPTVPLAAVALGAATRWTRAVEALVTDGAVQKALGLRIDIWSRATYIIQDLTLVVGLGCFQPVMALLYPHVSEPRGSEPHAHNLYLQVAVELGLVGLASYLVILGLAFVIAAKARRIWQGLGVRDGSLIAAACLSSLSGMCVHGLMDAALWANKGAVLPWAVIGLANALYQVGQRAAASRSG